MKTYLIAGLLAAGLLPSRAADNPATTETKPAEPPLVVAHSQMPVFHPPGISSGALPIRVGGGSRGGSSDGVKVEALVPDAVALTTKEQPSLYWFQSKESKTRCEVTLTEPNVAKPLLVLESSKSASAGIHRIRLSDFKVKLKPGVVYKWSVALVLDPSHRSQDILATGIVQHVEPSAELSKKLATADDSSRAAIYASEGIWYDAMESVSNLIEKNPKDKVLQDQRASLLKQVGLDGARVEKAALNQ